MPEFIDTINITLPDGEVKEFTTNRDKVPWTDNEEVNNRLLEMYSSFPIENSSYKVYFPPYGGIEIGEVKGKVIYSLRPSSASGVLANIYEISLAEGTIYILMKDSHLSQMYPNVKFTKFCNDYYYSPIILSYRSLKFDIINNTNKIADLEFKTIRNELKSDLQSATTAPKLVYKRLGKDYTIEYNTFIADNPTLFTYDSDLQDVLACDCTGLTTLVNVFGGKNYMSNAVPNRPIYSIALSNTDSISSSGLNDAFASLSNLKKVDFSKVTSFGKADRMLQTFALCSNLEAVDLGNVDMTLFKYISGAFHRCHSLKHISFPTSIENIEQLILVFSGCGNLKEIDLSMIKALTHGGHNNFSDCTKLEKIDIRNADFSAMKVYDYNGQQTYSWVNFSNCVNLKEYYGGKNMKYSYSLADSPLLSKESALHCIENLYDFISNDDLPTSYIPTLTFHDNVKTQLNEDEIAIATLKGWTIA